MTAKKKPAKRISGGQRMVDAGLKPLQMAPLTADELELIREAATLTGRSMRQYSRIATIERAKKDLEESGK